MSVDAFEVAGGVEDVSHYVFEVGGGVKDVSHYVFEVVGNIANARCCLRCRR